MTSGRPASCYATFSNDVLEVTAGGDCAAPVAGGRRGRLCRPFPNDEPAPVSLVSTSTLRQAGWRPPAPVHAARSAGQLLYVSGRQCDEYGGEQSAAVNDVLWRGNGSGGDAEEAAACGKYRPASTPSSLLKRTPCGQLAVCCACRPAKGGACHKRTTLFVSLIICASVGLTVTLFTGIILFMAQRGESAQRYHNEHGIYEILYAEPLTSDKAQDKRPNNTNRNSLPYHPPIISTTTTTTQTITPTVSPALLLFRPTVLQAKFGPIIMHSENEVFNPELDANNIPKPTSDSAADKQQYYYLMKIVTKKPTKAPPPTHNTTHKNSASAHYRVDYTVGNSSGHRAAARHLLSSIDFDADPCEDFYEFACGLWPAKNPIPADRASYSTYAKVSDTVAAKIREAIDAVELPAEADSKQRQQRPAHFMKRTLDKCMDRPLANALGGEPLMHVLRWRAVPSATLEYEAPLPKLGCWPMVDEQCDLTPFRVEQAAGALKRDYGVDTLLHSYAYAYELDSSRTVLQIAGATLPLGIGPFDHQYYLMAADGRRGHKWSADVLRAYEQLVVDVAVLVAADSGAAANASLIRQSAEEIVAVETQLAGWINWTLQHEYGLELSTLGDLQRRYPDFDWKLYLENLLPPDVMAQLGSGFKVEVTSPEFVKKVTAMAKAAEPRVMQNYVIWRMVKHALPFLSDKYATALADFDKVFRGIRQRESAQSVCEDLLRGRFDLPSLAMVSARAYVEAGNFDARSLRHAEHMVESIRAQFELMVAHLHWMDAETKIEALKKLVDMRANVAYPRWIFNDTAMDHYYHDLTSVRLSAGTSMFSAFMYMRGWAVRKNTRTLIAGGPAAGEAPFGGPPTATDAWYSAPHNAISVPVGELHAPFYSAGAPPAVNYGAIGAVVGHELSHALDQRGSSYDSTGTLHNWWTDQALSRFNERTRCLVDQYSQLCSAEAHGANGTLLCVDGRRTLSENLADLAGLRAAYYAFKRVHAEEGGDVKLPRLEWLDGEQLFFTSFAAFWCGGHSGRSVRHQLLTDFHAPDRLRVAGTLRNMQEFATAFRCAKGTPMNPIGGKCNVW